MNLDINNVFKANPVLTENTSFAVFRQPASILPARIARVRVRIDFEFTFDTRVRRCFERGVIRPE